MRAPSDPKRNSAVFIALYLLMQLRKGREPKLTRGRLDWNAESERLLREGAFDACYRMSSRSFEHLVQILAPFLLVDYRSTISRENIVQMTIRCLVGGSFHDVRRIAGVSIPSYYRLVQKGIDAGSLSSCGLFEGCIGCIDGWLCRVRAPTQKDTQGTGQRKYFSGHYQAFGINVQCVCDFESRFTYVSAVCPGSVSDLVSYEETELSKRVEKLPVGVYLLGDNAYMLSEHLLTPFPGKELPSDQDAFNFYLSQLRIRVAMAFGLLISKWRSFRAPIEASIEHTTQRKLAAQKLHNVCITERLHRDEDDHVNASEIEPLHFQGTTAAYLPSDLIIRVGANSLLRDIMVRRISDGDNVRPTYNVQRREREDNRNA